MSDLNEVLREVFLSAGHADIQMKVELEQKLPNFDFDQIKRVVINLPIMRLRRWVLYAQSQQREKIRVATHFNSN